MLPQSGPPFPRLPIKWSMTRTCARSVRSHPRRGPRFAQGHPYNLHWSPSFSSSRKGRLFDHTYARPVRHRPVRERDGAANGRADARADTGPDGAADAAANTPANTAADARSDTGSDAAAHGD